MRLSILLALLLGLSSLCGAQAAGPLSFERGSWAKLRADHAGQPTVIHFWGLTCGPCLVELPQWGKLQAERSDLHLLGSAPLTPGQRSGYPRLSVWEVRSR